MKKNYMMPAMQVLTLTGELPIAASNGVDSDGNVNINVNSIGEGSGDDAVRGMRTTTVDWNDWD